MMDYFKCEENLIREQIKLTNLKKQRETLSKLDNTIYKIESLLPEHIPVTMKFEENLSLVDKLKLPLKITGRVLGVGKHKRRFYTEEELKKSVETHKGKVIPLKLDHRRREVSSTIGAITRLYWDDVEKAVKYEGHINDETQARNVLDNVAKEVSAGVNAVEVFTIDYGITGRELEYLELSIVTKGSYRGNTLEVVV